MTGLLSTVILLCLYFASKTIDEVVAALHTDLTSALSADADSVGALGVAATPDDSAHAALLRLRVALEASWAAALSLSLDHVALGVLAAGALAGVGAAAASADRVGWAVRISAGTLALGVAAGGVWIADLTRWAEARVRARLVDALGGRVAWPVSAQVDGGAVGFGGRVRTVAGSARADGRVVRRQADSMSAACVTAHVVALVVDPVAGLCDQTVGVAEAADGAASLLQISRVADVLARWALALRHMVVGHADSAGATAQAGADRDALATAVGSAARLRLGTLGVGRAGVARQRLAAGAVVRVAVEAADALAGCAVVDSHALRVGRALGALAYRCALLDLERIGQTGMCDGAVIRAGALGHARALAAVGARILLETVAAEADWA